MRPRLRQALLVIAEGLADIPYRVGGSAMLALLGDDVPVGDIDIMVGAGDRQRVIDGCSAWVVGERTAGCHPLLASRWLLDLEVIGEEVEVMGGLAVRIGTSVWELPMRPGPVVEVEGVGIPLAAVGPWVVLYSVYKPERARRLSRWLSAEERDTVGSELPRDLGIEWLPATPLPDSEETR
jgi:hypothetical protein